MSVPSSRPHPLVLALLPLALVAAARTPARAQDWSSGRPDGHAPLGVMGDHTHEHGEIMLSYRFMPMRMDGNRRGTDDVSPSDVLGQFPVTPLRMPMSMHMFGIMAAPSSRLTLMGMVPVLDASMDHLTRAGARFTTGSAGLGDVRVSGLVRLLNRNRRAMHLNLGISLPTGSIDEMDVTPASAPAASILPYPMQTGSGTVDLMPGATILGQSDDWSWGAQGVATIRLGTNDRDYRLGHRGMGTGWVARRFSRWLSASARLEGSAWGNVHGADPALNPRMVPTADPLLRGGERLDLGLGLNFEYRWVRSTGSGWRSSS
ncbi:MAG: hypothetical protein R2712_07815 [Vicinamibacterales bacterium]